MEMLTDCSVVGGGLGGDGDGGKVGMSEIGSGGAPSDCSSGSSLYTKHSSSLHDV